MEQGLKAKREGRKYLKHNKFQAIAKKLNGENDTVSAMSIKF